jgi:hypothetical protein
MPCEAGSELGKIRIDVTDMQHSDLPAVAVNLAIRNGDCLSKNEVG